MRESGQPGRTELPWCQSTPDTRLFSTGFSNRKHFPGWSHLPYAKHILRAACIFSFSFTWVMFQLTGWPSAPWMVPVAAPWPEPVPPQPRWPRRRSCRWRFLSLEQTCGKALLFLTERFCCLHRRCRYMPCIACGLLQAPSLLSPSLSNQSRALAPRGWVSMAGAQCRSVSYRDELRLMPIAVQGSDSCASSTRTELPALIPRINLLCLVGIHTFLLIHQRWSLLLSLLYHSVKQTHQTKSLCSVKWPCGSNEVQHLATNQFTEIFLVLSASP